MAARNRWAVVRRIATIAFTAVAVTFIVLLIVGNWDAFVRALVNADIPLIIAAILAAAAATFCYMLSWRALLMSMGYRIPLVPAGRIFFTSQLGKYIPGAIWPILVSGQMGVRVGVPPVIGSLSTSVALLVNFSVSAVFSIGAVLLIPDVASEYWPILVLTLVLAAILLAPPILRRLLALALRLIRHGHVEVDFGGRGVAAGVGWSVLSWIGFGAHVWLIAVALGAPPVSSLIPAFFGYALAWAIGFLVVIAPAGAGVREAIMLVLFASVLGSGSAVGLVVISRLVLVLVDVGLAAVSAPRRAGRRVSTVAE